MSKDINTIMQAWTPEFMDAAQREGWDLFVSYEEGNPVQVQRIDDPEQLPSGISTFLLSDTDAMCKVFKGTLAHHEMARKIIKENFPEEWKNILRSQW